MDDDRYTRITLRIPRELHAELQRAADTTSKSLNAEIIGRLQGTVAEPQAKPPVNPVIELKPEVMAEALRRYGLLGQSISRSIRKPAIQHKRTALRRAKKGKGAG
jgi:hypothetical protein